MSLIIPNWKVPKQVKAISTTRLGGYSAAPYQGLNLGSHVGDELATVLENRQVLVELAGMPSAPIWLNQTHSTHVEVVDKPTSSTLDADGLFTTQRGVVCSAMTADCLPVLLTNTQGTQVAAVHAGWRGLAHGIVENAVEMFEGEVIAWLVLQLVRAPLKLVMMYCKHSVILTHRRVVHLNRRALRVNGGQIWIKLPPSA
ncbi:uncharacterized conserved protein [Vibrio ponticus]|nr:uncharacterized conserved protein [Vibrio ponticus]